MPNNDETIIHKPYIVAYFNNGSYSIQPGTSFATKFEAQQYADDMNAAMKPQYRFYTILEVKLA
jgi:hypothetical protein